MSSSRWWTVDAVHRSDLNRSHWWLCNLPSRDDVYVFAWTRPTLLCFDGQPDARHLPPLVDTVTVFANAVGCRRSTLSKKPAAWSEILDIQVVCQLSTGTVGWFHAHARVRHGRRLRGDCPPKI